MSMLEKKTKFKIQEIIELAKENQFVLPEIQREFVWDLDRIAELWDSIYRGYPIGQLLFWKSEMNIPVYSFIDNSPEQERFLFINKRPHWTHQQSVKGDEKIIILDGQQRITSLLLGVLDDGVSTKRRSNSDLEKLHLCIYVGDKDENGDNEIKLFDWKKEEDEEYVFVSNALNSRKQDKHIRILKKRLRENYASIDFVGSQKMLDVIEIFRRLNNNGKNMTRSELFLAMWFGEEKAHGLRKDLDNIREAFGDDFSVKDATITQLLMTIFGEKQEERKDARYSVEMFNNISKNINRLERAVKKTICFLNTDCGIYTNNEMISHSLFIPLIYVFYKNDEAITQKLIEELKCFTYRALIFDLFGSSTNTTLSRLKKSIEKMKGDNFIQSLDDSVKGKCFEDNNNTQTLDEIIIKRIINLKKGPKTNMILLLLRQEKANNIGHDRFDQDHLVATDLFKSSTAIVLSKRLRNSFGIGDNEKYQISEKEARRWGRIAKRMNEKKDNLPNLWLLESSRNREKGKKLLNIWYDEQDQARQKAFWEETFLEEKDYEYLKITNFETIYDDRERGLILALEKLLKVPKY